MANEKRLIDANALIEKLQEAVTHKGMGAAIAGILIRYIEKLPTVDAVEVVRCKNCKYWKSSFKPMPYCCWVNKFRNEDDFCSYGEGREKDEIQKS